MLCTSYHSNNTARTPRSACPPLPPTPGSVPALLVGLMGSLPALSAHTQGSRLLGVQARCPHGPQGAAAPAPSPPPRCPRASAGTVPSARSIPSAQVLPAIQAPDHTALLRLWVQRCPSPGPPATRPLSQTHMLLTVRHNWGPEGQALWPGLSSPRCPGQGSFTYREGPGC